MSPPVKVFGCRPSRTRPRTLAAGVPPREETARDEGRRCRARSNYGDFNVAFVRRSEWVPNSLESTPMLAIHAVADLGNL